MMDWPEEAARQALLCVPREWQSSSGSFTNDEKCYFEYRAEQKVLQLVSVQDKGRVIDILDPEDVIGVTVEIQLVDSTTAASTDDDNPIRAVTSPSNDNNPSRGSPVAGAQEERPTNAPSSDTPQDTQAKAVLVIYAYPRQDPKHNASPYSSLLRWCGMGNNNPPKPNLKYLRPTSEEQYKQLGHRYAFHRRLTVVASEDVGALQEVVRGIRQLAGLVEKQANRGRALVVVNPKSGPNCNAEDLYDSIVHGILKQAQVDHCLCITTHPQHAKERMMKGYKTDSNASESNNDIDSGDDILKYSAVICMGGDGSLHEVLQGIKTREDSEKVMKQLAFGIVGAGTSNGMAKSIAHASHEQSSILDAAFLIAKGYTHATDISLYQTTTQSYWSFLTFSWGMIADIDIESEVLRSLGPLRFDIWGVLCVLKMRSYRAKFTYLPGDKEASKGNKLPAINEPITSDDWVVMEEDFLLFYPAQVSHAAEKTYNSPPSRLDDGVFQVLIVRAKNVSRLTMAKILLALETGTHVNYPQAEWVECVAYRLEPLTEGSCNDLDGEVVEAGPIQGQVMPGTMNAFCK